MEQVVLTVILVIVAFGVGFILGRRGSPCSEFMFLPKADPIEIGDTTIGDVYDLEGTRPLIGFLDAKSKKVYASEATKDRVKKLFGVKTDEGSTWTIDYPSISSKYTVFPLGEINFKQLIYAEDVFAMSKAICYTFKKGTCLNFVGVGEDEVKYSWKVVVDTSMCAKGNEDCAETWREETVTLYDKEDCKGNQFKEKKWWPYCHPG